MDEINYKQIIIVRKDLNMSAGKLAAQVSHASMAFLADQIRNTAQLKLDSNIKILPVFLPITAAVAEKYGKQRQHYSNPKVASLAQKAYEKGELFFYVKLDEMNEPQDVPPNEITQHYEANILLDYDIFNNWFCGSFTKVILQAKNKNQLLKAETLAKENGIKYDLIYDRCFTELMPEEENGTVLTCIGFPPLASDKIDFIAKHYQLYKE